MWVKMLNYDNMTLLTGLLSKGRSVSTSSQKSSIEIKITRSDAINDLHNRVHPENARYHTTHHFLVHLAYTFSVVVLYLIFALPVCMAVFFWFIGFFNALLVWIVGAPVVGLGFLLLMRHSYYSSLKPKGEGAPWYAIIPIVFGLAFLGGYAAFGLTLVMFVVYLLQAAHLTQIGVYAGFALWILGGSGLVAGLGIYTRHCYFPKAKRAKGIPLGLAYQHYVNTFHYAGEVGTPEGPQDRPVGGR